MSPKEKARQAIDLLREAVAEIVEEEPTLTGIEVGRRLGIANNGISISVKTLLKVNMDAVLSIPERPCC